MKIEKISDKQIRCTLTREDLASRQIKLSELAYGSDKAKALFQDMMQMAAQDFGFEADNMPLMIEAIPISMDSILLVVTKVEDPDELDTRFSRFSSDEDSEEAQPSSSFSLTELMEHIEGADEIIDLIHHISDKKKRAAAKTEQAPAPKTEKPAEQSEPSQAENEEAVRRLTRVFQFRSLDDVIRASSVVPEDYSGPNMLFKDTEESVYYLILRKDTIAPELFNQVCNRISEYAFPCKHIHGMEAFMAEHMETTIAEDALQKLRQLS